MQSYLENGMFNFWLLTYSKQYTSTLSLRLQRNLALKSIKPSDFLSIKTFKNRITKLYNDELENVFDPDKLCSCGLARNCDCHWPQKRVIFSVLLGRYPSWPAWDFRCHSHLTFWFFSFLFFFQFISFIKREI